MVRAICSSVNYRDFTADIIDRLDIRAEYQALGVRVVGQPNDKGWCAARSIDRPDRRPSAGINTRTVYYHDFAAGVHESLFDAAAHAGRFLNSRDARDYYADRAGVHMAGALDQAKKISVVGDIDPLDLAGA